MRWVIGLIATMSLSSVAVADNSGFQLGGGLTKGHVWGGDKDHFLTAIVPMTSESIRSEGAYYNARYVFNRWFSIEGSYSESDKFKTSQHSSIVVDGQKKKLDMNDFSSNESSVNLLTGVVLDDPGLYGFVGVGYYIDKWDHSFGHSEFKGFQFPIGVGINLKYVSLEAQFIWKETTDYRRFQRTYLDSSSEVSTISTFKLGLLANF